MNIELIRYGILEERTDVRFHVGFESVIIFRTDVVKNMIMDNGGYEEADKRWRLGYATQTVNGKLIRTGEGWLIRPSEIEGCAFAPIPKEIMNISTKDDEGTKGDKATIIINQMVKLNLIPSEFLTEITRVDTKKDQIKGIDLKGKELTYQVKCDLPYDLPTKKYPHGTGNLFIQRRECNPKKKH